MDVGIDTAVVAALATAVATAAVGPGELGRARGSRSSGLRWGSGPRSTGDQVLSAVLQLPPEHLDRGQRVAVHRDLVQPQTRDPGEPKGEARPVAATSHDHVERDLDDDRRFNAPVAPVPRQRVLLEPAGAFRDLHVGEAAVGLPDRDERTRRVIAHGERVVGEDAMPLAVAALDADHDAVQRCERLLHLQPAEAAPPRCVDAGRCLLYTSDAADDLTR